MILRTFMVTFWDAGLIRVSVNAGDALDAIHVLQRQGIRPAQILSMREEAVSSTVTGLQKAVDGA